MAKRYLGGGISFEQKDVYQEFSEEESPSPGGSSTLAGLTDVDLTNPTDGQILVYDAETQKWVNGNGSGGSSTLSGLTDVDLTSPADGQVLVYDATSQKWVNGSAGGIYCIDSSVVPTSVTIDNVEYIEIYLYQGQGVGFPFYIIPESVIVGGKPFYLKETINDGVSDHLYLFYPVTSHGFMADPAPDDPTSINPPALTVSTPVFVCQTELGTDVYLIPDTAEFKTVKLPH